MNELKNKIRDCDLTQFSNYNEYIKYVQKLVYEYMKNNKDLSIDDLKKILEEVK